MTIVPPPPDRDPLRHFHQGFSALHVGRLEEAIHHFKQQVRSPSGTELALREIDQGEEGVTISLDRQPRYIEGCLQRSSIRLARGIVRSITGGDPGKDCKNAFEDSSRAVDLVRESVPALLQRANILLFSARFARKSGRNVRDLLDLALRDLDRARSLDPRHTTLLHTRGITLFYLSNLDRDEEKDPVPGYTAAIESLLETLPEGEPNAYILKDLGTCRIALARILIQRKQRPGALLRAAIEDLSKSLALHPTLYAALYERGLAHFALRRFDEAIADWRKCMAVDPEKSKKLSGLLEDAEKKKAEHGSAAR